MSLFFLGNITPKEMFINSLEDTFNISSEDKVVLKVRKYSLAFFTCFCVGFLWHGLITLSNGSFVGKKMWIMRDPHAKDDKMFCDLSRNPGMLGLEFGSYGLRLIDHELILFVQTKFRAIRSLIGVKVEKLNSGFVKVSNRVGSIFYGSGLSKEVYDRLYFRNYSQVKNHLTSGVVVWGDCPYIENSRNLRAFYHVAKMGDLFVQWPTRENGGTIFIKRTDSRMRQESPYAPKPELVSLKDLEEMAIVKNSNSISAIIQIWKEKTFSLK
jgi:hypothetical protein